MVTAFMDPRAVNPASKLSVQPWLHVLIIAALIVSRRPDALLHPQFWAEDGQIFYHDAYTFGWPALLHPLNGYMQLLSRLVAMLCQPFPLAWCPGIYAGVAFVIQILPARLILSSRLDTVLPDYQPRIALAYFYAVMPNSYELSVNLTNAQWHLAFAAFLIIIAGPAPKASRQIPDMTLIGLSGLSGPFSIFLAPFAWFAQAREPNRTRLLAATIISGAALIQVVVLLSSISGARAVTPLGASIAGFTHIFVNQIVLGGLIGDRLMTALLTIPLTQSVAFSFGLSLAGLVLLAIAFHAGPLIHRQATLLAAGIFIAALITPVASTTQTQWNGLAEPGVGLRYFVLPVLVWFTALLVLRNSDIMVLKVIAGALLALTVLGIGNSFFYANWPQTGFSAAAARFAHAQPGTAATFPENPPGWQMTLIKH